MVNSVVFLHRGKIVANDRPEMLARSVLRYRLRLMVGDGMKRTIGIAEQMKMEFTIDDRTIEVTLDEGQIPSFLSALAQSKVSYTHIKILEPSLEDYFLKMARKK